MRLLGSLGHAGTRCPSAIVRITHPSRDSGSCVSGVSSACRNARRQRCFECRSRRSHGGRWRRRAPKKKRPHAPWWHRILDRSDRTAVEDAGFTFAPQGDGEEDRLLVDADAFPLREAGVRRNAHRTPRRTAKRVRRNPVSGDQPSGFTCPKSDARYRSRFFTA